MGKKVMKEIVKEHIKTKDYIRYFITLVILFFVFDGFGLFLALVLFAIAIAIEMQTLCITIMSKHLETINDILKDLALPT